MNTSFTAPTFIALTSLATEAAIKHCKTFGETGKYPVTDPGFWYQDASRVLALDPVLDSKVFRVDPEQMVFNTGESLMVFKTSFASACAAYFSALKKA